MCFVDRFTDMTAGGFDREVNMSTAFNTYRNNFGIGTVVKELAAGLMDREGYCRGLADLRAFKTECIARCAEREKAATCVILACLDSIRAGHDMANLHDVMSSRRDVLDLCVHLSLGTLFIACSPSSQSYLLPVLRHSPALPIPLLVFLASSLPYQILSFSCVTVVSFGPPRPI